MPETLKLSDLYEGPSSAEVQVTVLRDRGRGDIVDQYVRFCKISDEERKKHGYSQETINETIRRCMEAGILTTFLASRRKEVHDIMVTLFDQEKVMEIHDYNVALAAEQKGHEKGREEGIQATVAILKTLSIKKEAISQKLIEQFGVSPETAMKKVEQYWK